MNEKLVSDLQHFTLSGDYLQRLSKLTDLLLNEENKEEALPLLFGILERFPEEELGSPGPLVHAIEKCFGYEEILFESLERQPSTLSVWMVYRLMKYDANPLYREKLKKVLIHPKAGEQTKEDASLILSWNHNYT